MRSFATLAFAGITGIVLFKLVATILIPVLGLIIGMIMLTAKFALIAAIAFFIYSMIRRRREAAEG